MLRFENNYRGGYQMNRSKILCRNGLLLSKVFLTCLLLFYLLEPAFAQKQTITDSKDLSKLNLFENLSGLENSWISGGWDTCPAYYAIKEKDPTHKIVESKTWQQAIFGPNNQRTGTNTVAYFLVESSKHSPSELQDIVDYIFKDGPGSFPEKYKKLLDRDNKINYKNMPNQTTSSSGAGYELGRTWSGIVLSGFFVEAEFDQGKQEIQQTTYRGVYEESSAITGTEQHKIKTTSYKPKKTRLLLSHLKCKVVHHNQYILVAGVMMTDGLDFTPRENRDKDGWVQSYGYARLFPYDLWRSILTKLDPFLTNGKEINVTPLKTVPAKRPVVITIFAIEGEEVEVDPHGAGEFQEVTKDDLPIKLDTNARIITGFDSSVTIDFSRRGMVQVKELSNYAVKEFLITDEGITAHTDMKVGEVNIKVDRKYPAIDFTVSTPTCIAGVRGTEFTVSHKKSPMQSTVTVYSGKVEVAPKLCSEPARILTAGQRITVSKCFGGLEVFEPKDPDKPGASGQITQAGTQPSQTGSGVTGGATVSVGGPVQGTARLLTVSSNRDMVGRNETYKGNGRFDAVFRAQFSAPNRTVTAVEVSNTNGLRSVWDTRPNNRLWLGGVVIGGRTMNRTDGSVNFSLGSGQNTLDFFVEDNGSIRGGKTNYRMTIFFASGDSLIMDVTPGTLGQPGGIRIESATYGANCGVAEGNVTAHIAEQCNGKSECRYTVDYKIIGDPARGCAKTYTVQYRCGNNPQVLEKSLPAEAGWGDKAVLLECADSSGGDGGPDTGWQTAGIDSSKSICPKAAQWQDGGGFMILNGSHRFDKGWFRRTWGKKDPFYLNGEDTKLAPKHSYDEVMKHALIKLGKVTARGPGFLVVYGKVKGSGAWLRLYDATTGQQFWPHTGGSQKMYQGKPWVFKDGQWTGSWSGKWVEVQTADLSANIQMGGWVPAKQTRTYEIKLDQGWYNNMNVPFGSMGFGAPQEIDYELWFFPREGGGVKLEKYPGSTSTTGSLPPSQEIKKVITGYGKKK